jgi:hypothetical protein
MRIRIPNIDIQCRHGINNGPAFLSAQRFGRLLPKATDQVGLWRAEKTSHLFTPYNNVATANETFVETVSGVHLSFFVSHMKLKFLILPDVRYRSCVSFLFLNFRLFSDQGLKYLVRNQILGFRGRFRNQDPVF